MDSAADWLKLLAQIASPAIAVGALYVAHGAKVIARRKPLDDLIVRLVVEEFESVLRDVDLFAQLCAPAPPAYRATIVQALNEEREKAFCRMRLLETVQGDSGTLCRMRMTWVGKAWDSALDTDDLDLDPVRADALKTEHTSLVKAYNNALRHQIKDIQSGK